MIFQDIVSLAQKDFPDLKIAYKDQSTFMKFLGAILFFNKDFKTTYITTLGSTIYFPSKEFVDADPVNNTIVLMHELVHMADAKKYTRFFFSLSYLLPQLLSILRSEE